MWGSFSQSGRLIGQLRRRRFGKALKPSDLRCGAGPGVYRYGHVVRRSEKGVCERARTPSRRVRPRSPWMAFLVLRPAFHDQPTKGVGYAEHAAAAALPAR
jgi:hypothetical protein